ncbi:hypothetical protein GCM10022205_26510 [Spinactinospora alkalitolerans]
MIGTRSKGYRITEILSVFTRRAVMGTLRGLLAYRRQTRGAPGAIPATKPGLWLRST